VRIEGSLGGEGAWRGGGARAGERSVLRALLRQLAFAAAPAGRPGEIPGADCGVGPWHGDWARRVAAELRCREAVQAAPGLAGGGPHIHARGTAAGCRGPFRAWPPRCRQRAAQPPRGLGVRLRRRPGGARGQGVGSLGSGGWVPGASAKQAERRAFPPHPPPPQTPKRPRAPSPSASASASAARRWASAAEARIASASRSAGAASAGATDTWGAGGGGRRADGAAERDARWRELPCWMEAGAGRVGMGPGGYGAGWVWGRVGMGPGGYGAGQPTHLQRAHSQHGPRLHGGVGRGLRGDDTGELPHRQRHRPEALGGALCGRRGGRGFSGRARARRLWCEGFPKSAHQEVCV
jgi:hypothetical protein